MNPVLLDLGFIQIYWYSIFIILGLLIGGSIIIKEGKTNKLTEEYLTNLIFYCIIFGIIGARIYYVIFEWDYYSKNIIDIFKIWEGGLAIHGGIIAGLIFIIYYSNKYKVNTWRLLDTIVVGLIIGQAIGRWGNFFNGEAHGPLTTLDFLKNIHLPDFIINGMKIDGLYYQPTFLYESIWCFIGFVILIIYRKLTKRKVGQTTGLYLILYGIGRFFIEGLRTDSLMLGSFKIAQIISILFILIGIMIIILKRKSDDFYNKKEELNEIRF